MYDLFILDLIFFAMIIKGTEDMIKEYINPRHHIKGAIIGIGFGGLVGFLDGLLIALIQSSKYSKTEGRNKWLQHIIPQLLACL